MSKNKYLNNLSNIKLVILTPVIPPAPSGQANVLLRLFEDWDPNSYSLIASRNIEPDISARKNLPLLKGRSYCADLPGLPKNPFLKKVSYLPYFFINFIKRLRLILRVLRQDNLNAVLACSGDIFDLPAGYLASRLKKIPFYAYLFDDYIYQWPKPFQFFAKIAERVFIKNANFVFVPNEYLARAYQKRYGIEPKIIHNPACADLELDNKLAVKLPWDSTKNVIRIVYTGSIYHAHYDAFQNLAKVLNSVNEKIELHLFTPQEKNSLKAKGIIGDSIFYHDYYSPQEIKIIQQNADILFLPLALNSNIPEVIKTAAPGKMGEYLTMGKPILAYAPEDSFVSWYFKNYDCGFVVNQNDVESLKKTILFILENEDEAKRIVQNAVFQAKKDFHPETIKILFANYFRDIAYS